MISCVQHDTAVDIVSKFSSAVLVERTLRHAMFIGARVPLFYCRQRGTQASLSTRSSSTSLAHSYCVAVVGGTELCVGCGHGGGTAGAD